VQIIGEIKDNISIILNERNIC